MRSVHTLASVHVHWGATSLPCLARGTPGRFNCLGVSFTPSLSCPPWLHGRYPLPRYYGDSDSCSARSGTEQVSLVHALELLDIPSPTTPCAPVPTLLRVGQAWPTIRFGGYRQFFGFRSPYAGSSVASGRIEFVSPRSRNTTFLRTILSLSVALHEALLARSYFRLLTGSSAREGLSPSCSSALPSAHMPLLTEL